MPIRPLKILVVVMGIMLVAGFTVLVIIIAGRMSRGGPVPAPLQPFAAAPLDLPAGAHIETIGVGPERMVLDLVLPGGNRELWVIDLASGRRLGAIPLRTAP